MYVKLILKNAKRSAADYLIYIITLSLCTAMFYAFMSITSRYYNPDTGMEFDLDILGSGMKLAILCLTLLVLFLINYVNQYMLRRRMQEFALQTMMGMEQKTTALIFFFETLVMGLFSLFAGILLGALLSQIITAMLLSSYGKAYSITWTLFPDTLLLTISFFILCFGFIGFWNTRSIRKIKIIDMLNADRRNEASLKVSKWHPAVTGLYLLLLLFMSLTGFQKIYYYDDSRHPLPVRLLLWGNALAPLLSLFMPLLWFLKHKSKEFTGLVRLLLAGLIPVAGFAATVPALQRKYYLSLGKGNLNTYMAFLLGCMIYFICSIIYLTGNHIINQRMKSLSYKYERDNLFFHGQILSKLKTTSKTMTVISLTMALSIVLFLSVPALSGWALGYLDSRAAFDVQIFSMYNTVYEENRLSDDDYRMVSDYLQKQNINISDECLFTLYLPRKEDFHKRIKYDFPVLAISLSSYNKLLSMKGLEPITLEDNQFTTQWQSIATEDEIQTFTDSHTQLETDNGTLFTADEKARQAPLGEYIYNSHTDVVYVLPDRHCENLLGVNRNLYINTGDPVPYPAANGLEELFAETYPEQSGGVSYYIRTKSQQTSSGIAAAFIFKAGTTYVAVILLISCFTVLALQQLNDAGQFSFRFGVLKKMGMDEGQMNQLVLRQLGFWFGLPISISVITAAVITVCFFSIISAQISAYIGFVTLFIQTAAIITILAILLLCYFITTWLLFHKAIYGRK